jgi:hypothetical protein
LVGGLAATKGLLILPPIGEEDEVEEEESPQIWQKEDALFVCFLIRPLPLALLRITLQDFFLYVYFCEEIVDSKC